MNSVEFCKKLIFDLKRSGIKSAEIDVRILLEFVTGKSREFLLVHPEYELTDAEIKKLNELIARRKKHEPIAYLTGHKEFFGLDFEVTPDVLIPRPETEMLVEEALESIKSKVHKVKSPLRILDIGTGSGNIIISLAKNLSGDPYRFEPIGTNQYFLASDNSAKSLTVAKKNAKKHRVDEKIKFIQSDLFENINRKFDLILVNLPYVPAKKPDRFRPIEQNQLYGEEIDFEPKDAIFAEDNGSEIIKKFLVDAKKYINNNGLILAELDPRNADDLKKYALKIYKSVEIISDLAKKKRLLKILT